MAHVDIAVQQGDEVVVADYTNSRFQLASISKQFTAAALLLLVEEGTLLLEDPISRWIDGCPEQWRDITLHHLLSHTSGLGHWDDYPMINLGQWVEPSELLKPFTPYRCNSHPTRAGDTAARGTCCWRRSFNDPPTGPTGPSWQTVSSTASV